MFVFVLSLTILLFTSCPATAKTVSGVFRSDTARETRGQYITRFQFHGENAVIVYHVDDAHVALQREARLLLFQDLEAFDNLSCLERVSAAHNSIIVSKAEQNQTIPQQSSPQLWYVMYADRYTCQEEQVDRQLEDIHFQIILLNPDAEGNPLDHFSAEEAGLHSFYFLSVLAYFVASCIYLQPLWQALSKGGPMLTVLKVLSTVLFLQGTSVLLNYVHMARYARDGIGMPLTGSLAELCDMIAQVQMVYMLLSLCVGWSLSRSRKSLSKPLQWDSSPVSTGVAVATVITQAALLIWEQFEDTEHHSFHSHHSIAGRLLMVLRVALALFLASVIYQMVSAERSSLKRDFYLSFTKGCFLWFLCQPVLVVFSLTLNEHQREKSVLGSVVAVVRHAASDHEPNRSRAILRRRRSDEDLESQTHWRRCQQTLHLNTQTDAL